jgi:hypothetical protein
MSSTSGRIQSGSANFSYFYFQWQLVFQDTPSNYSHINWQWGLNTSNSAFWGSNAVKSVSGYINGGLAFGANTGSWDLPNIPRAATLSALSMDGGGIPATDEGPMWVEFANPAGSNVQVFIDSLDTSTRIYTSGYVGSRHNVDFSGGTLTAALQNAIPNSNTGTIRIGIYDASFGSYDW